MKIFNPKDFDATQQPMFFGESVNVSRFDVAKYPQFQKLFLTGLGFYWSPEEIDLTQDGRDFEELPENAQRIFLMNLQYQTLLDSVQGRSPFLVFGTAVSLPELENFLNMWAFFEGSVHSRSYTHIIRNVKSANPGEVLDEIPRSTEILRRAESVTAALEASFTANTTAGVSMEDKMRKLLLALMSTNILEGLRFYVSFACSFAFAESGVMEGNAKIIKFIARDEAVHLSATQHMLNYIRTGREGPVWQQMYEDMVPEFQRMYMEASNEEKDWADELFKFGPILGLNANILKKYVDFLTAARMNAIKLPHELGEPSNPLPWINRWFSSQAVQEAPQETEKESYIIGAVEVEVSDEDLEELKDMGL